jgi:hypothetical protein
MRRRNERCNLRLHLTRDHPAERLAGTVGEHDRARRERRALDAAHRRAVAQRTVERKRARAGERRLCFLRRRRVSRAFVWSTGVPGGMERASAEKGRPRLVGGVRGRARG